MCSISLASLPRTCISKTEVNADFLDDLIKTTTLYLKLSIFNKYNSKPMGQALYRKYRSKSLDEIVGQEHITTTLKNALKSGKISHAYLLTGPRGVGKTSVARILAHEVNGLPYDGQAHLDIIEIDAASNRRIDEVRDLRDKVHILPSSAKYKVYIIDEVHMLTREAFNALLKTLEEPPAHAIFILATTEAHKLPETIISRTQHFAFRPINTEQLVEHLTSIAKSEKLKIDNDALALIAEHSGGSFRDSISLLDQVHTVADHVTRDDVQQLLGLAPSALVTNLLQAIDQGSVPSVLQSLSEARDQGISGSKVAQQLNAALREQLIQNGSANIELMKQLVTVPSSPSPDQWLELCLIDAALVASGSTKNTQPQSARTPQLLAAQPVQASLTSNAGGNQEKRAETHVKTSDKIHQKPEPSTKQPTEIPKASTSSATGGSFSVNDWPAVLAAIKKNHNTLYGILRMAQANMPNADTLTLTFRFAFHEKQLKDSAKRAIVTGIIQELFGVVVVLECALQTKVPGAKVAKPATKDTAALDNVSNIFGGAEVLES